MKIYSHGCVSDMRECVDISPRDLRNFAVRGVIARTRISDLKLVTLDRDRRSICVAHDCKWWRSNRRIGDLPSPLFGNDLANSKKIRIKNRGIMVASDDHHGKQYQVSFHL